MTSGPTGAAFMSVTVCCAYTVYKAVKMRIAQYTHAKKNPTSPFHHVHSFSKVQCMRFVIDLS